MKLTLKQLDQFIVSEAPYLAPQTPPSTQEDEDDIKAAEGVEEIEEEEGFDLDDPFASFEEDDPFADAVEEVEVGPVYIPKREFSIFEIKEDLYFDRIHSRIYFDIQSITLFLPGDSFYNPAGF